MCVVRVQRFAQFHLLWTLGPVLFVPPSFDDDLFRALFLAPLRFEEVFFRAVPFFALLLLPFLAAIGASPCRVCAQRGQFCEASPVNGQECFLRVLSPPAL